MNLTFKSNGAGGDFPVDPGPTLSASCGKGRSGKLRINAEPHTSEGKYRAVYRLVDSTG